MDLDNMTPQTRALIELLHDESLPNVAVQQLMEIIDALDEADTKSSADRREALERARDHVGQLARLTRTPTIRQL